MKRNLVTLANVLLFVLISSEILAQTISYPANSFSSPAGTTNYVFQAGTSIGSILPTGTTASSFTFGAGTTVATGLAHPWGLGIDPSGYVYIANYGSTAKIPGLVSKYNPLNGQTTTFADGSTDVNISNPQGIAFDQTGNAYILNYNRTNNGNGNYFGNANVNQYTSGGTYTSTLISGLGAASGITNDLSNNLYIANAGNTTASKYNSLGAIAFSVNGQPLPNPVGVAVDNSGNIYVVDNTKKAVYKFSSTGAYVSTPIPAGSLTNPFGIAIDASGNMYVGDSGADAVFDSPSTQQGYVYVYPASGPRYTLAGSYKDPRGLVIDKTGNLYVSDFANNNVTEYMATGGYHLSNILPPGLSFDSTTGIFSGTPTSYFPKTTYMITAYSGGVAYNTTITIQCTATLSITYSPNDINVFTQNAAITALAPTTSGTPTSFSVSPNLTTNTGLTFDTGTGIISGTPSILSAAQIYTVTCTDGFNTASTTISIACVQDDYWTGKNSTDWFDTKNWSAGVYPTITNTTLRATIGVRSYTGKKLEPVISGSASAYYLEFGGDHTLTVNTGGTLAIGSSLTIDNNATPNVLGSGAININTSATVDVNGTGVLTISSPLTFTLKSDQTGSAAIDEITSGGIKGQVSVERYLTAQRGYRLIASPVNASNGVTDGNGNLIYSLNYIKKSVYITGTTLAAGGFDVSSTGTTTSENPTIYLYRESAAVSHSSFITGNFRAINNINYITTAPTYSMNNEASAYTIPVSNGFAFFFRGNRATNTFDEETKTTFPATTATLTTTGYLNQGQIIFRDWYSAFSTDMGYSNPDPLAQGFNLVANPYACTIDLDKYNNTSSSTGIYANTAIERFFYELNPKNGSFGYYKAGGGLPPVNGASRYIVSGQAFFAHAVATGGMLIFNESAKYALQQVPVPNLLMASKSSQKALAAEAKPQMLRLEMALDTVYKEEILIVFDGNSKPGYVLNEDALYRLGSNKVNLASISADNQVLAINQLPLHNGLTIPLRVGSNSHSTYSLNLTSFEGVPRVYDIWLKDAFTGDSVDMRSNPSYKFSITSDTGSYGAHRFTVLMRQNPGFAYHLLNFTATKATGKQVQVNWVTENEGDYTNFTVERSTDGGKTYTVIGGVPSTGAGEYGLLDTNPGDNNLYRLKQEDINNAITYSAVIPVSFATGGNNPAVDNKINIYPNPAVSTITTTVNVAVTDKNPVYKYTITNNYGLIVKQGTSPQTNWQTNVNDLMPGTYIIQVVNNKDKSFVGESKLVKL